MLDIARTLNDEGIASGHRKALVQERCPLLLLFYDYVTD